MRKKWSDIPLCSLEIDSLNCAVNPYDMIKIAKRYQTNIQLAYESAGLYACRALELPADSEEYRSNVSFSKQYTLQARTWEDALSELLNMFFKQVYVKDD
jgi:hypothetical protein